jgi:transposase
MIGPGVGVQVYLAAGVTDMRRGSAGLSALAPSVLHENPTSGAVFAFRCRKGDRLKLLHWDGHGFCLYYKVFERGYLAWPKAMNGAVHLTSAQRSMLWEGIDWRRPAWTSEPTRL